MTDYTDIDKLPIERAAQAIGRYSDDQWARWGTHTTGGLAAWEAADRGLRASGLIEENTRLSAELVGLLTEVDRLRTENDHMTTVDIGQTERSAASRLALIRERDAAQARAVRAEQALAKLRAVIADAQQVLDRTGWATYPPKGAKQELRDLSVRLAAAVPVVGAEEPTEQATGWKCADCGWTATTGEQMKPALWNVGDRQIDLVCPNCGSAGNFVDAESPTDQAEAQQ